jgi:DNA-binding PadR family transcriptional regulator
MGELEQQVLLALLRLGGEAYSVPLVLEMEEKSGREVAQSAVFIILRRLEEKGLVSSRIEPPSPGSSGRERRYFKLEPEGRKRLEEARRLIERLWDGVDTVWEEA